MLGTWLHPNCNLERSMQEALAVVIKGDSSSVHPSLLRAVRAVYARCWDLHGIPRLRVSPGSYKGRELSRNVRIHYRKDCFRELHLWETQARELPGTFNTHFSLPISSPKRSPFSAQAFSV